MERIGVLKLKAQVFRGAETAMGPGKADLLRAIAREGSISAAARALGMSYRRSWLLVDTMNRCWTAPLVESMPGQGARVTALGERVLAAYRTLEAELASVARSPALAELESLMAPVSGRPPRTPPS